MYAIIEAGGKQYRVSEGDLIDVERRSGEIGQTVSFDEVLLVGDQKTIHLGKPILSGARVVGTIAEQGKEAKVIVFKFKRRKKYRRKQGHRQLFTRVRIDQIKITVGGGRKPKTEQVAEKTSEVVTKAKVTKEAVARKAPAKTIKKKAAGKVAAKAAKGKTAPASKKKAVKTSKKSAAPKAAKKKTTKKSVKKTAKKNTKKAATKKDKE